MTKISSNKALEALLFIGFAFAVWLTMRISNTEVTRQINVELIATGRSVNGLWLEDSTQEVNVIIEASGLNALFMSRFNNRMIAFDSDDYIRGNGTSAFLLDTDIQTILHQEYGREYNFYWSGDSLFYPSSSLVQKTLPVVLLSQENISIPEGHRWIQKPEVVPDSIICVGPEELIRRFKPTITAPTMNWSGKDQIELSLNKFPRYISTKTNWISINANADTWTENKIRVILRYQSEDIPVEIWLSGPMDVISNSTNNIVQANWTKEGSRLRVDIKALADGLKILNYEPKYIAL